MTEEQVFLNALELPNPSDRSAYLDSVCGTDSELRQQVEELLAAHFKSGEFLNEPVGEQLGTAPITCIAETLIVDRKPDEDPVAGREKPDEEQPELAFLQPSTRPDSLGRIGHYEVLEVLGKGGFGIVFRAFDDVLQRVVALKVLAPAIAATSPARKRFLREAQASARVRHENVVQVHAVEELPTPYLVMEFIAGETLQQRLDRKGPLELTEIVSLGRQIAEGLAAAHETGLIHRDIKPGNVLIEKGTQERVKITDFGLARAADDASMTQSGVVAGTPMYMAPEQAQGDTLDQRADLFSLGSVLYVMASGRPPFRAATTFAVLKRVVEEEARSIKDVIPETPQWLCDVIGKLHAKKPDDRFQTAREVADVLADCEAQLKANAKLQDFSRIPRTMVSRGSSWQKWAAVAAVVLFFAGIALAQLEFAGVTHVFRGQPPRMAVEGWGTWTDPLGDCRLTEKDGRLTISVPGGNHHDLNPKPNLNMNAPRILRDVEGDFEARVTVHPLTQQPYVAAGLIVWLDDTPNFLRLIRYRHPIFAPAIATESWAGATLGINQRVADPVPDGPLHLRVRRNGNNLHLEFSGDGHVWTQLAMETKLNPVARVRVGVAAICTSPSGLTAAFERFTVQSVPSASQEPPPPTYTNSHGMEFVIVPKGKSWLGGGKDKLGDKEVEIPADFYLGKYEVTQEEWEQVMGENPSHFSRNGEGKDAVKDFADADLKRFPVENVSWDECQIFVAKLNEREKETGWVYRLPTAAESEYACRGGPMSDRAESMFDFYLEKPSNALSPTQANCNSRLNRTCNVGSYSSNRMGIYDLHGNVREWCGDTEKATDGASRRVSRGGGWHHDSEFCQAASRYAAAPSTRYQNLGLRLARVPAGAPSPEVKSPPLATDRFALAFDGHESLVRIPSLKVVEDHALTVEAWTVLGRSVAPNNEDLVGNADGTGFLLSIVYGPNKMAFSTCLKTPEKNVFAWEKQPVPRHELIHLAGVYDGKAEIRFYVNGQLQSRTPALGGLKPSSLPLALGSNSDGAGGGSRFLGRMNEVRISKVVRYDGDFTPDQRWAPDTDTLALYHFDEGAGTALKDSSGNNHDGEIVGAKWVQADGSAISSSPTPFTDVDVQRIAALPAEQQIAEVRKELVRLNPKFNGVVTPKIENDAVTEISITTDEVENIAPVRALTKLMYLDCRGTYPNKGKLSDLSPLSGMTISRLDCSSTQVSNLRPLTGLPLTFLHFNHNPVSDLAPLKGMPLQELGLAETRVSDLSPLQGMQLRILGAQLLPVTDLSPLAGMPLTGLDLYHTIGVTDLEALKGMPLEGINLQDVPVSDLSPLKGMTTLRTLVLQATKVSDLKPLADLKLTDLLLHGQQITDLSPLKGVPLMRLHLYETGVTDLRPLEGMPLVEVGFTPKNITQGLDVLRDIKTLTSIGIDGTQVWPAAEFWQRYEKGEFNK